MKKCNYPFDDLPCRLDKYEKITHLIIGTITSLIFIFCLCLPSQAGTKCYKDICVGQKVMVTNGLYKGNEVLILDILKNNIPDDDAHHLKYVYKYYVRLVGGNILYLQRNKLGD